MIHKDKKLLGKGVPLVFSKWVTGWGGLLLQYISILLAKAFRMVISQETA
jgi:hypothetical protein